MSKKRILFVAPFPPPVHGAALRNQSVAKSELINEAFDLKPFHANQASDIHDIGVFSWRKVRKTFTDLFSLVYQLLTFRPHLVYFNISLFGFALYRDAIYASIFKLFGFRILYHLRTQGVREQVAQSKWKSRLFLYLFKNVDVICLSHSLFQDVAPVFTKEPYIVNNGIPVDTKPPPGPNEDTVPQILFVSNYSIKKGINELFAALKLLKHDKVSFRASLVGKAFDYTEEELKRKTITMGLQEEVDIVGPLYGEHKTGMLTSTDIFVLPTYFEAFPGVILEAMQFGLPVVSTKEGAIPDIVDDGSTGVLTDKQDVAQLAAALKKLILDKELRKQMGSQGREKFFDNYTLEKFEKNMVRVFKQVISDE